MENDSEKIVMLTIEQKQTKITQHKILIMYKKINEDEEECRMEEEGR